MSTELRWDSVHLVWSRSQSRNWALKVCRTTASAGCCSDTTKPELKKSGRNTHTWCVIQLAPQPMDFHLNKPESISLNVCDFRNFSENNINLTLYTVNEPWLFSVLWCSGVSAVSSEAPHILKKVPYPIWLMVRTHLDPHPCAFFVKFLRCVSYFRVIIWIYLLDINSGSKNSQNGYSLSWAWYHNIFRHYSEVPAHHRDEHHHFSVSG